MDQAGQGRWRVLPISAALDLFDPKLHFRLTADHPDLPATGLKKTRFIIANMPVDVPEVVLEKRLGCLQGRLASDFLAWLNG